jgi:predicted  nucleic acid-binding Zn-ribbon protein
MERELSELSKEIKSIRCHSETTEKTLSERVDKVDKQLSCLTIEAERLCTSMKSTQKDLTLTLERLSRNEAEGAQLTSDLEALRVRSEDTQKHLTAQVSEIKANLEQLKTENGTVGQLRSDLSILKDWTSWFDSPIVTSFPLVFDEFRGER